MDQPVANKHTVNTLTDSGDFRWYLTTHASWFFGMGLQMVIFPYLVAEILLGSPKMIGIAQMSLMAPTWFLMLFAGAIADRRDGRRMLILLNGVAIMPPLVLSFVVAGGTLNYTLIIIYALSMGVLSAFSMPTRDSILNDVVAQIDERNGDVGSKVQRAVGLTNIMQFGGQTAGMITAAAATFLGTSPLIFLHAVIAGLGMMAAQRLHPAAHAQSSTASQNLGTPDTPPLQAIAQGLTVVYKSPILLPLVLSALSVGLFFAGSFMVTLPVLVREEYGGGIYRFSAATVSFWVGTIISSITLIRMGHIRHRGRLVLGALSSGVVMLTTLAFTVPFFALCLIFFVWGLGAGVALTLSRGIVQEVAPAQFRARILAIYQLGFSGGMPLGSLMMGFLIEAYGPHNAVFIPAAAMATVLTLMTWRSRLWSLDQMTAKLARETPLAAPVPAPKQPEPPSPTNTPTA